MMFVDVGSNRALDEDAMNFRKQALRDAVLCMGWLKLTSVIFYIVLDVLVYISSRGPMSLAIQIMLMIMIPLEMIHGLVLFLGVLDESAIALEIGLWLCLLLATYNSVIGVIVCVYFIRSGTSILHFVLAAIFGCQAISLIAIFCHDILIIFAYKKTLEDGQSCCPNRFII